MSSVMSFNFNAVNLCVVTINEKPWTRARKVCKTLEYGKVTKATDVVRQITLISGNWQGSFLKQNLWIGQNIRKNTIFTSIKRGCMR